MNLDFFQKSCCLKVSDCRKKLTIAEKKCQIVFLNNAQKLLLKIEIDKCMSFSGKRCDFLVIIPEDCNSFFIELKGCDFIEAIRQIDNSMNNLLDDLKNSKINVRIILTKVNVPDIQNNPLILKLKKRLNTLKGNLRYKTIKMTEII